MKIPTSAKLENFILKALGDLQLWLSGNTSLKSQPCILCYHSISKDDWEFSVDPHEFERQIRFLSQAKNVLPLGEIIKFDSNKSQNNVAITFDDAYQDLYKNALPILKRHGLKAAVFVMGSNKLVSKAELGNNKKLLKLDQIKKLKNEGWEIGFHSNTHRDLTKLDDASLKDEIINGKKRLEEKLGFRLRYFAYPKGRYSSKIIQIVKDAGFEAAFTVDGGGQKEIYKPFRIPRITISKFMKINDLTGLLTPFGLRYNRLNTKVLKFKDNIFKNLLKN